METNNTKTASYNESHARQLTLRHILYPGAYGVISEAVVALLALILFNLSDFSNRLLVSANTEANPLSLWSQPIQRIFDKLDGLAASQAITLFLVWSVVGILLYILIFRALQIIFNVKRSVGAGVEMVRQDHEKGLVYWLGSLHDLFVKVLIFLAGIAAIATGSLVCFGVASQELHRGLIEPFPANAGALALSFIGALLSVRLVALGLTLASRHFRNWYLY